MICAGNQKEQKERKGTTLANGRLLSIECSTIDSEELQSTACLMLFFALTRFFTVRHSHYTVGFYIISSLKEVKRGDGNEAFCSLSSNLLSLANWHSIALLYHLL